MVINKIFGKALRARRKALDLSQDDLSRLAGIQRGYISLLERGAKSPSLTTLHHLAQILETTVTDFMIEVEAEYQRLQVIPIFIYALQDPRTQSIHYIGQSQHPQRRLHGHLSQARRNAEADAKCFWIAELLAQELKPALVILEETDGTQATEREAFWIVEMFRREQPLTNQSINWREIKQLGFDAQTGTVQLILFD